MTPDCKPTLRQFHYHCPNCPLMFVSEIHSCPAILKCELSGFCLKLIKLTLLPWFACYWFFLTPQTLVSSPLLTHGTQTFLHCAHRLYSLLLSHVHLMATTLLRCNTRRTEVCLHWPAIVCHSPVGIAATRAASQFLSLAIIFLYLGIV